MLKLCGNMNLLGVNAKLWGKPKNFSNLMNFHYIGEQFHNNIIICVINYFAPKLHSTHG
jgi:hypothetical protein